MKHFLPILFTCLLSFSAIGQVFTGTTVSIPDSGDARIGFSVTGLPSNLSTNFGLEKICFNIVHPRVQTLDLFLISPNGTEVELAAIPDYPGANFQNTCLNGSATTIIHNARPPYSGTFRAEGQLGEVNEGNPVGNGTWILLIRDLVRDGSSGNADNASLTFSNQPAIMFKLMESNLPIVTINTRGQVIPDDPKIDVRFGVIFNGPGRTNRITDFPNAYWGEAGIELRGKSSQEFPKKPYSIELRDTVGGERKVALLGMPSESDWVLIPNYTDKSLMRNALSYELSRAMGQYATRSRHVEVVLNGRYAGVYQLMERLKRNDNRVNISKMEAADTTGTNVTGGYIIKLDKLDSANAPGWFSNHTAAGRSLFPYFQYEYPKPEDIQPAQARYIQNYVRQFEDALYSPTYTDPANGYAKYVDVMSFVDYFFLQEVGRNVDAYRFSTYMHKLKSNRGGLLRMGPIWDQDIAFGNIDFSVGPTTEGWRIKDTTNGAPWPGWWDRLMTDTNYVRQMRCRWINLRQGVWSQNNIFRIIDSNATVLDSAQRRNFNWWTTMGAYVWPNPRPLAQNYADEVQYLKTWLAARLTWMDNAIGMVCTPPTVSTGRRFNQLAINLWPNPASSSIQVSVPYTHDLTYSVMDAKGQIIRTEHLAANSQGQNIYLDIADLSPGIYTVSLQGYELMTSKRFVKQ